MKKIFLTILAFIGTISAAKADTIVVINNDGTVVSQMQTLNQPQLSVPSLAVPVLGSPSSGVTVVRQTSGPGNYYYDSYTTNQAVLAGVTTAVVGGLIYEGFHHRHHKLRPPKHFNRPPRMHHR